MIDPALLRAAGEALYGPWWQERLAVALHINSRNLRYWLAGRPIPSGISRELRDLLDGQAKYSARLRERLEEEGGGVMSAPLRLDEIKITDEMIEAASEVLWRHPLLDITESFAETLTTEIVRALIVAHKIHHRRDSHADDHQ